MRMTKYKNHLLFSLIILSQLHTAFRGGGNLVWILNDVEKTYSLTCFLFVKHLTVFILYYINLKPKGVNRNLLTYLFILSGLDVIHFIVLSGFGYGMLKLVLSVFILIMYNTLKKWRKYLHIA
jgi:hypothetical protein